MSDGWKVGGICSDSGGLTHWRCLANKGQIAANAFLLILDNGI